jgi:hypothetical protein
LGGGQRPTGAGRRCEGAPAGRARPSPLRIKKALASKWYKFSGDRADMEGKSCEGHQLGLSVGESDRGYAKGGKAEGGAAGGDIGELTRLFCLLVRIRPLKAERHGVERVHSVMRPYLAWLFRRSRCFSRSVEMMV